eukprot:TRINITY_DN8581_c0_g1_i1.p1 TRINITY_DN8581_c0_g1~~TRINITY_DN8581_c0_g1_i1.p1  ORF type:complete len:381 (+),score=58.28 TRINITY_DN8581_c0_g1_i1:193-1335(+)
MVPLDNAKLMKMASRSRRPPALGFLSAPDDTDELCQAPAGIVDVSASTLLQDAHHYDNVMFPRATDGQIRPFFAHKSSCYIAKHQLGDESEPEHVVVKFWNAKDLDTAYTEARLEAQILKEVAHDNVVRLIGMKIWGKRLGVVTLLATHPCRTLDGLLLASSQQHSDVEYTRGNRYEIILGIAKGIAHVHDRNVVHRDIKPNNVLLMYDAQSNRITPAICDFGSAQHMDELEERATGGAITFTPPSPYDDDPRLDDLYRYALVVWCVLTCAWPFKREIAEMTEFDFHHTLQGGHRPPLPAALSEPLRMLITSLWSTQPLERVPPLHSDPALHQDANGENAPMRRVIAALQSQEFIDDEAFAPVMAPAREVSAVTITSLHA